MYVYHDSEDGIYTVGFYDPNGKWHPESDQTSEDKAARRVHFLNGGSENINVDEIIGKENLIKKVNEPIFKLRQELVGKGYTEYRANRAIAGALPNCICLALIEMARE